MINFFKKNTKNNISFWLWNQNQDLFCLEINNLIKRETLYAIDSIKNLF